MYKKFYYIGTSHFNHLSELKIIPIDQKKVLEDNLKDFIYFSSETEAKDFLNKMRNFILINYPRAQKEIWYSEKN